MEEEVKAGKSGWKPSGKGPKGWEPVVRRRVRLSVVLGITFCVTGGAVMASSFLLSWAEGPMGNETLWELLERGGVYLLAAMVPLSGVLAAIISSLDVLAEKGRKRVKAPTALGALAASLVGLTSVVLVAMQVNQDLGGVSDAPFGPALFMSVFGSVLAVSGGMILTIDYLEERARRGRFSTSGGSAELRAALRPAAKPRTAKASAPQKQASPRPGGAPEALAETEAEDAPEATGLECPNCYSPVRPNWRICPICGEELQ